MYLLVTIAGVFAGYHYALALGRRYGIGDRRRWVLLAPLWAASLVLLLTVGTEDLVPQAVQSAGIGSLVCALGDLGAHRWRRRSGPAGAAAPPTDDRA